MKPIPAMIGCLPPIEQQDQIGRLIFALAIELQEKGVGVPAILSSMTTAVGFLAGCQVKDDPTGVQNMLSELFDNGFKHGLEIDKGEQVDV